MKLHLEKVHDLGDVILLPQVRGGSTVYSMGRGRHAEPVLKLVEAIG